VEDGAVIQNLLNWFDRPVFFAFLTIPIILGLMWRWQSRRFVQRFTPWPGVRSEVQSKLRSGSLQVAARLACLTFLILAIAGPRLGRPAAVETRTPRDLVVVLDLSRSMQAEQPSRLDKGLRALRSLADTLNRHGDARVALFAFAAQPTLVFPLTADAKHLRLVVDHIANEPPADIRPEAPSEIASGTRIGAALRQALASLPSRPPGTQELLLVSDGDDPLDDDEWQSGIAAARAAGVPIHVVATGEPGVDATIPYRGSPLTYDGQVVRSHVRTDRLEEVAHRTGGHFFAAAKGTLPLGPRLHDHWRSLPPPADELANDSPAVTTPPMRAPFILAAFLCWLASSLTFDFARRSARLAVPMAALLLVSGKPETDAERWLRRGNDAFAAHDFDDAIRCYRHAAATTSDPGLAAFDAGAAHFRKGEYGEAEREYRRTLEDDLLPPERRGRAWFDLGNALLMQAGDKDRRLVEQAMDAYRRALAAAPTEELRRDATYNLELAGRRWLKTQPPAASERGNDPSRDPSRSGKEQTASNSGEPKENGTSNVPSSKSDPGRGGPEAKTGASASNKAARGKLTVLPDSAERGSLSAADAAAHLEQAIERIGQERRAHRNDTGPLRGKDW
jgi:Ca-activated chloride channel family protein